MSRMAPLEPPFEAATAAQLASMMPPGVPPIGLFRTLVRNRPMAEAMSGWGHYALSRRLSVSMRQREIVIDRVCARCGCEYEWGVHLAYFAERVGLTDEQIASLTAGRPADRCWEEESERDLIAMVDALHDDGDIDDPLWDRLRRHFDDRQLLDLLLLAGWYHAISHAAVVLRVAPEPDAPRFADYYDRAPAAGTEVTA